MAVPTVPTPMVVMTRAAVATILDFVNLLRVLRTCIPPLSVWCVGFTEVPPTATCCSRRSQEERPHCRSLVSDGLGFTSPARRKLIGSDHANRGLHTPNCTLLFLLRANRGLHTPSCTLLGIAGRFCSFSLSASRTFDLWAVPEVT